MTPHRRLPISARHAFALAFDLAVRRDALHSIVMPLLLRTPWLVALAILPGTDDLEGRTALVMALTSAALIGDYLSSLVVAAMLRFRARSVFNTEPDTQPAPAGECYARGLVRVPWLFVAEVMRNLAMIAAGFFLLLPGLWVGFRLSMATEAVVLHGDTAFESFPHSFHLSEGRLERWLEMVVGSVFIVLGVWFISAFGYLAFPGPGWSMWVSAGLFLLAAVTPVIQYAWTFFYLRLEEIEPAVVSSHGTPPPTEVHATPAATAPTTQPTPAVTRTTSPRLTLVEMRTDGTPEDGSE